MEGIDAMERAMRRVIRVESEVELREKWDVARYSGYGHASRESIQDEDYEQ